MKKRSAIEAELNTDTNSNRKRICDGQKFPKVNNAVLEWYRRVRERNIFASEEHEFHVFVYGPEICDTLSRVLGKMLTFSTTRDRFHSIFSPTCFFYPNK